MTGHIEIQKAYEAILAHDFEQAIACFERAIAQEPDNDTYHYKISITYARSNKLPQALYYAERACKLKPSNKEYEQHLQFLKARELIYQAEKYFAEDDVQLQKAVEMLREAAALDPLAIDAYLLMGLAHAELNEYNKALMALREVLKLDPLHHTAAKLSASYEKIISEKDG